MLVTAFTVVPAAMLLGLNRLGSLQGNRSVVLDDPLIQISEGLSMLQSFRIESEAKVPSIWIERLGEQDASKLWAQRDGELWWQAWPQEGEPCLILRERMLTAGFAGASEPRTFQAPESVSRHRGFVLLFADALNRQTFLQGFRPERVVSAPIEQFCFDQLNTTTAVLWKPSALASMAGPLTPLLSSAAYGCLAIEFRGRGLGWMGVVASRSLREASQRLLKPDPIDFLSGEFTKPFDASKPSDQSRLGVQRPLISLQSHSARTLFGSLLNRPLVRDGLENNYGLGPNLRNQVLAAPLSLQILPNQQGPFQAAVRLDLVLPSPNPEADSSLKAVSNRLKIRGLRSEERRLTPTKNGQSGEEILWYGVKDNTKRLLGGWSWLDHGSAAESAGTASLQMTLASRPDWKDSPMSFTKSGHLYADVRPSQLSGLGLIGKSWPAPIRRAHRLELRIAPLKGSATSHEDWRLISGYLLLP